MKVMMVTTEADNSFICRALEYGADEFPDEAVHARGRPQRETGHAGAGRVMPMPVACAAWLTRRFARREAIHGLL